MSLHSAHQSAIRNVEPSTGHGPEDTRLWRVPGQICRQYPEKQVQVSTGGPTSVTSLDRPVASSRFLLPPWPDPSNRGPLELATGSFSPAPMVCSFGVKRVSEGKILLFLV